MRGGASVKDGWPEQSHPDMEIGAVKKRFIEEQVIGGVCEAGRLWFESHP